MTTRARASLGVSMFPRIGSPSRDVIVNSDIEAEQDDVPVLDFVVLSLGTHLSRGACCLFRAARDVVVVGNRLRANESALEIAVNCTGRLRSFCTLTDGPGARFLRTGGEECLE